MIGDYMFCLMFRILFRFDSCSINVAFIGTIPRATAVLGWVYSAFVLPNPHPESVPGGS